MAASKYDREIIRYLRETYGVTEFARPPICHTANHRSLNFTYDGRPIQVTLHDSKQRQESGNLIEMKKQDIRRELGSPPDLPVIKKRTIEEITPNFSNGQQASFSLMDRLAQQTIAELSKIDDGIKLKSIDRAYLKRLIDEVNRVVQESDYRLGQNEQTGKWRFFTVVE